MCKVFELLALSFNAECLHSLGASTMHTNQKPTILPRDLGVIAYQKVQRGGPTRKLSSRAEHATPAPKQNSRPAVPSQKAQKQLKVSVLNSLHRQSNAGLVNIRDVAVALDKILKRT